MRKLDKLIIGFAILFFSSTLCNAAESAVAARIAGEEISESGWVAITPHRRNYFLPYTYNWNMNKGFANATDSTGFDDYEAKFQLSFKFPAWKKILGSSSNLYFAYTQLAMWQLYHDQSAPFRDTNYEPEIFATINTDLNFFGFKNRALFLGFVHQSNGRGHELLSRSWNRLYATALLERGNWALTLKTWYRIPEDSEDDDNPNIEKYYGYGELRTAYKHKGHVWSALLRNNLRGEDNKGAIELGWSFPLAGGLKGYVQYFNGYGESLLDYNHPNTRLGAGFMLNDWL